MNCSGYFTFKTLTFSASPKAGLFTTIHIAHEHFIPSTWHPFLGGGPVCNGTLVIPWKEANTSYTFVSLSVPYIPP